jgi:RimJ/RimL family protein N-acetyltransferase
MIRAYKPEDLETVMDIANRAWRGIYSMFRELYGEELFGLLNPEPSLKKGKEVRDSCLKHPEWAFVCEREGRIAGFITFWLEEKRKIGVIGNNAKDPASPEKGVGREMYSAVLKYFKQKGMLYAEVGTGLDSAHAPARRAYEASGFDIRHGKVTYYKKL